jgi:hypothetical protein
MSGRVAEIALLRPLYRSGESLFDRYATRLGRHHLVGQRENSFRGLFRRQAAVVDVGYQVPLSIGVGGPRPECHVGGQTLGVGEAGALTDQEDRHGWSEQVAEIVENTDSAIANGECMARRPAAMSDFLLEARQESRYLRRNGGGTQPIADRDLHIDVRPAALADGRSGRLIEPSTETRLLEKLGHVARTRRYLEQIAIGDELEAEVAFEVHSRVHGIDGDRMVLAQLELRVRAIGGAGSTDEETGRSALADRLQQLSD